MLRQDAAVSEVLVQMKKTAGRSLTPSYVVKIMDDGLVIYNGVNHVKEVGERRRMLSKSELKGLVGAFEEADFFGFEDEYTAKITDLPCTYLIFKYEGQAKEIRDYYNAPAALKDLEAMVEALVLPWVE